MSLERVKDLAGRAGYLLSNENIRLVVEEAGGMVPELSFPYYQGWVNTHFNPPFRGTSELFDAEKHAKWGIRLPFDLAGNFPCFPTFGNPSTCQGVEVPPCGHTAALDWHVTSTHDFDEYCCIVSEMGGEETGNIFYKKYDIILANQPIHYQVMEIENCRSETFMFGGAWHNTTGQPFVESGCILSASADLYHTPPVSHDPDQVERLMLNQTFESLEAAPAADGSTIDISVVPGMIGTSDFFTGRIPVDAELGWMSVYNPHYNGVYLTFFKGPNQVEGDEFTFYFNHVWQQYGGRNYTPWANFDGGKDRALAVGVESAISAWGYGLDYAIENPELMGRPTIIPINSGQTRTIYHATLATVLSEKLTGGVAAVDKSEKGLVLTSKVGSIEVELDADTSFTAIEKVLDLVKQESGQ